MKTHQSYYFTWMLIWTPKQRKIIPIFILILSISNLSLVRSSFADCHAEPIYYKKTIYGGCEIKIENTPPETYSSLPFNLCARYCRLIYVSDQDIDSVLNSNVTQVPSSLSQLQPTTSSCIQGTSQFGPSIITRPKDGFGEVLRKLSLYDACHSPLEEAQKQAVNLLAETLEKLDPDFRFPKISYKNKSEFNELMLVLWKRLLIHIAIESSEDPRKASFPLMDAAMILESGLIPLPATEDDASDGKGYFGYSHFYEALFKRVIPISIKSRTPLELAQMTAHAVISKQATSNNLKIANHDFTHGIGAVVPQVTRLGLQDPRVCSLFKSCLDQIIMGPDLKYKKIMAFYLIHETPSSLGAAFTSPSQLHLNNPDLGDFALELALDKKNAKGEGTYLNHLLGDNPTETEATCRSVLYLDNLWNRASGNTRLRVPPEINQILGFLNSIGSDQPPDSQTHQVLKDVSWVGILDKLHSLCEATHPGLPYSKQDQSRFEERFRKIKPGLMVEVEKELVHMDEGLKKLLRELHTVETCVEYRKAANL